MLVVRKQGGRNTNNDRYIYINVDDNPQPFPELRRLLDMNLGLLYQDKTFKLLRSGKTQDARDAAAQAAHYFPDRSDAHLSLGMLNYAVGDKKAHSRHSARPRPSTRIFASSSMRRRRVPLTKRS